MESIATVKTSLSLQIRPITVPLIWFMNVIFSLLTNNLTVVTNVKRITTLSYGDICMCTEVPSLEQGCCFML